MYARTESEYQVFLLAGHCRVCAFEKKSLSRGEVVLPVVGTCLQGSASEFEK